MTLQEETVVKRKNKMPFLDPEELKPKLREVFETQVVPQIVKAKMEQTAVEWLIEHLNLDETSPNYNQWVVEQAKTIEKEQITAAYRVGKVEANLPPEKPTTGEQYYNETFKSE